MLEKDFLWAAWALVRTSASRRGIRSMPAAGWRCVLLGLKRWIVRLLLGRLITLVEPFLSPGPMRVRRVGYFLSEGLWCFAMTESVGRGCNPLLSLKARPNENDEVQQSSSNKRIQRAEQRYAKTHPYTGQQLQGFNTD